jgi:hypothetical protein
MKKTRIITVAAIIILMASILPLTVSAVSAQNTIDNISNNSVAHLDGKPTVNATSNNVTKAEILRGRGVPGKGIDHAPGLQKPFNPKSKAAQNAGKAK